MRLRDRDKSGFDTSKAAQQAGCWASLRASRGQRASRSGSGRSHAASGSYRCKVSVARL